MVLLRRASQKEAAAKQYIDDLFSTYVYEGNGSTQSIVNGIDLSTEGGLTWIKNRDQADSHVLTDTERGAGEILSSDTNASETTDSDTLTAFNTNGFSLGADVKVNTNTENYVSWSFRKAPRFFDVVTYIGNGNTTQTINHNLGVVPGMIVVKVLNSTGDWYVYHKYAQNSSGTFGEYTYLKLNTTDAKTYDGLNHWGPTDSTFTASNNNINFNEGSTPYIAYLFAYDPLGPSGDGSDGLITCGRYTGNGLADGPEVDLGWEPQWLLIKDADNARNWVIYDMIRGMVYGGDEAALYANLSSAEAAHDGINPLATGFKIVSTLTLLNTSGEDYVYVAIRRPNKPPESAGDVFDISTRVVGPPAFVSDMLVDMAIWKDASASSNPELSARFMSGYYTETNRNAAEAADADADFDFMNGWYDASSVGSTIYSWMFKRAVGFFDVVCYEGTGVAHTEKHNLGVVPEMMLVINRDAADYDGVYTTATGATKKLTFGITNAASINSTYWNDTTPTDSVFTVGTNGTVNNNGDNIIAFLFATVDGISKVGSYTGNGTNQTIDCGFSSGARFILIKRFDDTGDWYIWDSERGIVTGNDPHLSLNSSAAQIDTDDSVDPDNSGFIVNQVAATNINVSSAEYIFYAVA